MKAGHPEIGSCGACGKEFSSPCNMPKLEAIQVLNNDPSQTCNPTSHSLIGMQYTCTRCGYVWRDYIEKEEKEQ